MGSQSLPPSDRLGLKKMLHGSSSRIHSKCLFVSFRNFCHLILRVQVTCRLSTGQLVTASRKTWNRWNGCSRSILECNFASCLRQSISDEHIIKWTMSSHTFGGLGKSADVTERVLVLDGFTLATPGADSLPRPNPRRSLMNRSRGRLTVRLCWKEIRRSGFWFSKRRRRSSLRV